MPRINLIPEVLYKSNQPYNFHYDNLPLKNILTRIDLVNAQVDINADILRGSSGTVGSLENRLSVSINDDGSLKSKAIDDVEHNIAKHTDGQDDNGTNYVRMEKSERDKLSLIDSEATNIDLEIQSISTTELFSNGTAKLRHSDTITFEFEPPDIIKANSVFPASAAHNHHYDIKPAHKNPSSPDHKNFITTSVNTPFASGSLRVYINGIRLSNGSSNAVRVPKADDVDSWVLTYIDSSNSSNGTFTLNRAIDTNDIIRIDFDESL